MGFGKGWFDWHQKAPDTSAQNAYSQALANQTMQLLPLQKTMLDQFGDVMSGRFDPTTSPMYASIFSSGKEATEDQYNLARENIIGGTARGGAQTGALADVELDRAGKMSSLPAQISQGILQNLMNKAYGAAFPGSDTSGTAMSGFQNITNTQMQAAGMNQQQQSSATAGIGAIIAALM